MFLSSPAVDRLSRDTTDLLMIARDLQNAGAGLKSIAEPVVDTTSDFAELVLAMLGVAAKLERRRIKERTARGRAEAKAKGVKFGRKPKLTPHQKREAIKRRDSDGETLRSIGRSYNVSAQTDREAFIMTMPPISSIAPSGNMAQQYLHRARMFFAGGLLALSVVGGASAGQFEDGIAALQRSDFAAAMRLLRPLAVKQNAGAQFNLGWMYANGKGVLQDFKEAAVWYQKAAEQGNAYAQGALGVFYGLGRGVPQDYVQAISWTRKAANQGYATAEYNLGGAYDQGLGVPRDYQQAVIWYRKAADHGDANALTAVDRISRRMGGEEQQLADVARQCSETALRRYALSSTDPAEKVALAAFNKCSEQWGRYADVSGRRIDAEPSTQEAHKNCIKYQGDKCPPMLPGSLYVMKAAEAQFTYKAATEVFDIRAEAAGK